MSDKTTLFVPARTSVAVRHPDGTLEFMSWWQSAKLAWKLRDEPQETYDPWGWRWWRAEWWTA